MLQPSAAAEVGGAYAHKKAPIIYILIMKMESTTTVPSLSVPRVPALCPIQAVRRLNKRDVRRVFLSPLPRPSDQLQEPQNKRTEDLRPTAETSSIEQTKSLVLVPEPKKKQHE